MKQMTRRNMEGYVLLFVILGAAFVSSSASTSDLKSCDQATNETDCHSLSSLNCSWCYPTGKPTEGKCLNETELIAKDQKCTNALDITTAAPAKLPDNTTGSTVGTKPSDEKSTTEPAKTTPSHEDVNNETTTAAAPTTAANATTTAAPNTTTPTVPTTTAEPVKTTTTVTPPTTTAGPTPTPTKSTTVPPHPPTTISSTTPKPIVTTTPPHSNSSSAPHTDPGKQSRHFDAPSFIGGMVLSIGIMAISFVTYRFYRARTDRNYHTLQETLHM